MLASTRTGRKYTFTAPAWVLALLGLGALLVAAIYLKLNSKFWFEHVMTPVRIGFVYVCVVSMLNLVKLQWLGGVLTILSGFRWWVGPVRYRRWC